MFLDHNFRKKAFYILAGGELSDLELSLLFYFFSRGDECFESFVVQVKDLSFFCKRREKEILNALYHLESKRILKLKQSIKGKLFSKPSSLALSVNKKYESWDLPLVKEIKNSSEHSSVRSNGKVKKISLVQKTAFYEDSENQAKLLVDFYSGVKGVPPKETEKLLKDAQSLIGAYSFDASLFMLKHFYEKIDSFSELAKNWDHYQRELQKALQKIDFLEAKKQHDEDDKECREVAKKWLFLSEEKGLTEEETRVLEILVENSHPRRQLFWAYRFRENYPNLQSFFKENIKRMLPVTTAGRVVKKKD